MKMRFNFQSLRFTSLISRLTKIFVVIISILAAPTAYAADDAVALLNKMNHALHQLNYKGTLAYLSGDALSSLHIEHTVVKGVEVERVVRLNEAGNEVSRELQGFSLSSIPTISPEMEKVYSFDMGRENRVANIPCRIVTARPKDRERYLQKYCIDMSTGMLLDYRLVGKSHKAVEQFMFTAIEIKHPEEQASISAQQNAAKNTNNTACNNDPSCIILPELVKTGATATSLVDQTASAQGKMDNTITIPKAKKASRQISTANLDDGWVMEVLPAGYEMSQAPSMQPAMQSQMQPQKELSDKSDESNDNAKTKHYIVTDVLSSISVFISPLTPDAPIGAVKVNSGALNVVTRQKYGSVITVVGEAPESTLKNIVDNLHKK